MPKAAKDIQVFQVPEKAKAMPAPDSANPMEAKLKVVFAEDTQSSDSIASTAHLVVMLQASEETGGCRLLEVTASTPQTPACLVPISDVRSFLLQEPSLEVRQQTISRSFIHRVVAHHRWLYCMLIVGRSYARCQGQRDRQGRCLSEAHSLAGEADIKARSRRKGRD